MNECVRDHRAEYGELSTSELVNWLKGEGNDQGIHILTVKFEPETFEAALPTGKLFIEPSNDGLIAEVLQGEDPNDKSRDSRYFGLHKDGLYKPRLPSNVLLACANPGNGNIGTFFSDTRAAVQALGTGEADVDVLRVLQSIYIGRDGKEYKKPLIGIDRHGGPTINYGVGYIRPFEGLPLSIYPYFEEQARAVMALMHATREAVFYTHQWRRGDLIVFDNERFMHGRSGSEQVDCNRHLYRVWIDRERDFIAQGVQVVLFDDRRRVLMMRRRDTGYMDGFWGLPSGKVELTENATIAGFRETREETGVVVSKLAHLDILKTEDDRWQHHFLLAETWEGIAYNREPSKCSEIKFFGLDELPGRVIPIVKDCLEKLKKSALS